MQVYQAFLDGSIHVPGKDLCDMSGATGRTREEFTVYNVMLPRNYHPAWQGNLFERRCKASPCYVMPLMKYFSVHAQCAGSLNTVIHN